MEAVNRFNSPIVDIRYGSTLHTQESWCWHIIDEFCISLPLHKLLHMLSKHCCAKQEICSFVIRVKCAR